MSTPSNPLGAAVTLYQTCRETVGSQRPLGQCLALIRDDARLAIRVAELRPLYWQAEELRLKQADSDEAKTAYQEAKGVYDEAKKKGLPAITLSGTFTRRAIVGIETYSGVIQADLDHLKARGFEIGELKVRIAADPHVVTVFKSPGGDGLKIGILVSTGAADHAEAFAGMSRYFVATYGIAPDEACKDVSRLCFLGSDPALTINEVATPLDWKTWHAPAPGAAESEEEDAEEDSANVLPLDAFPQVIQPLAVSWADVYQVDIALPAVSALSVLSVALGNAVQCTGATNGRATPCNLFTVISAPSGYGKGVVGVVAKPLLDASAEMAKRFEDVVRPELRAGIAIAEARKKDIMAEQKKGGLTATGRAEARAELTHLEREIERNTFEAKTYPALYTGSATGAALGVALHRNGETLLSFALESGDAIRIAAGKYSSDNKADYDLLLSGYTGEPFAESRVTRDPVRLDAPCLSVLWAVQPTLLRELYGTAEAQERGLLARINVVQCDDDETPLDDGIAREVPPELAGEWENLVRAALDLRRTGRKITFRAEAGAREVFRGFHNEAVRLRNGEGRESEAKLKRCRENAIRIANVIAASEWLTAGAKGDAPPMTTEHAARGVAVAQYFLAQTLALTKGAVYERREARLAELLKCVDLADGRITLRLLRDNHGFGEVELKQIVARNSARLRIETRPAKGNAGVKKQGGRPSPILVKIPDTPPAKPAIPAKPANDGGFAGSAGFAGGTPAKNES